jgi:hypothetical protein
MGSQEDYWRLNGASAAVLKAVSPHLRRVVGQATAVFG